VDRRGAGRAARAHLRLDVARGWWHAHAERRPQRLQAAAVHDRALQGDRSRVGAGLHDPPARRADAGRQPRAPRLAADGAGPRAVPRHGARDHHGRRGQGPVPAHGGPVLRGRAVRPRRGPCGPHRRHQRLRDLCPERGGRGGAPHDGHRPAPARGRDLGRHHRPRRDPRRAHRQRWRAVGPRGRAHGWHRAARAGHGAHVPRHGADGRGRGPQRPDRPRDADGARLRRRDLHQAGAGRDAARDL
jgi:hypothetical protein